MTYSFDNERFYNYMMQTNMKGAFIDFVRRHSNMMYPPVSKATIRRFMVLIAAFWAYIIYKHLKQGCRKVFKRTDRNLDIINTLMPIIKTYKPSIHMPFALFQIFYGEMAAKSKYEFEKQVITLPDEGEVVLEWFPNNFAEMDPKVPIILFNFGVCGTSKNKYYQELCDHVLEKKWRMVAVNRRGFGFSHLKNPKFIHQNETADLDYVSKKIAEIYPQSNLYMMGVSAGANNAANYLGRVQKDTPIRAYVGISNPFNIGRISFTMKHNMWGAFYSKLIADNIKELYRFHYDSPHFQHLIETQKLNLDSIEKKLKIKNSCWRVDKLLTHKLGGYESVYDYYIEISSEHVIDHIKVPTLFISNEEDPICLKENIPIEKIYKNENTILLFMERGGHIEYMSGLKAKRWCYDAAMKYLEYWESK